MRKAKSDPSFEHYLKDSGVNDQVLIYILKGHLVIEALLLELLQVKIQGDTPWKWNFPTKTSECVSFGLISRDQADALNDLNDLRNDFAHILGQSLDFDRVFSLVKKASKGFEFSDMTIHTDKSLAEEWYGIESSIVEVLDSFYFELAHILFENGGANRLGG